MRVTVRFEYPGIDCRVVEFVPAREPGDTPEPVHAYIAGLLRSGVEEFELPAVGKNPFPFALDTVREVVR